MEGKLKKVIVTVSNDIVTDQRMARICNTLVQNGYQLEIIGRVLKTSPNLTPKTYKQTRLKLWFNKGIAFYVELNLRLFLKLLFQKADLIYTVDADTLVAGSLIKIFKKVKLVFDAHELFSEVPELEGRTFKKKLWQIVEKNGIQRFADLRITVSESVALHYKTLYSKSFIVVKNCPLKLTYQPKETREPYILYQGALNEGRGLEALIMASKHIDMSVLIAGSGDLDEKLKTIVKENGVEKKVLFLGKLLPEKLIEITANAWLGYNLLEKKGLSYYYSLSNKTFDYIQAGIPQLMPSFPEYIQLNQKFEIGVLTEPLAESIVTTVNSLIKNHELYLHLKQESLKAAKIYVWENEEEKLVNHLRALH